MDKAWTDIFGDKTVHNGKTLDVIVDRKRSVGDYDTVKSKLERVGCKGCHALTVTFTDQCLLKYREEYLEKELNKILLGVRALSQFILVRDYSSSGRMHYHGIIDITNIKSITNLRRRLKVFGITKVKLIDDNPKWVLYCIGQYTRQGKNGVVLSGEDISYITNII